MAVEDAAAFAKAVAENGRNINAAIAGYERARMPRAAELRMASRRQGAIYHMGGPLAFARDFVMKRTSRDGLMARMDWVYRYRV